MKAKNTTKANILREVNKSAWSIVRETKATWKQAIKTAWTLLKRNLKALIATISNYFEITFTKVSTGEITTRTASNAKIKGNNLLFFSITDNGFRSSIIKEIIDVKPLQGEKLELVRTC
jgi:hypothetical protein